MDYFGFVLVRKNMQKQIWTISVFWFYVELFCLLFYKYIYGIGIIANRWRAITVDVIWWQQSIITDVRIRTVPKCTYK